VCQVADEARKQMALKGSRGSGSSPADCQMVLTVNNDDNVFTLLTPIISSLPLVVHVYNIKQSRYLIQTKYINM